MRKTTVDTVNNWTKWWNYHSQSMDNASIDKKIEFMAKALHGALSMIVLLTEEIREVEMGRSSEHKIVLPIGVKFDSPMRQEQ